MVSMEQKKQRRARRTFTAEFKQRAVDLALKEGVPISQVAHDLDVQETGLRKWVKQAQIDSGKGPEGALTTEETQELSRLRREVRVLKEEREILKKAAAFFAKESR